MSAIWTIATNTFREVIRDRILYGIVVFALLLLGLSLALGGLSFTENARISADFGFAGIQLGVAILSIFVGSTLVAKEIEKQTILTLLARSISRNQFLIGKFLGLTFVVVTVMAGLALVLGILLQSLGLAVGPAFFGALFGVLLESLILISLTLLFGVITRPIMTVIFSSSVFLIGHWISSLGELMKLKRNSDPSFQTTAEILMKIVPDLEKFNWRSAPIYGDAIPIETITTASMYAMGWTLVILALTSFAFRRRDFV
jgi:Cu-processing system permease protein